METLIGEKMKVIDAKNKSLLGINGKVIDETKNTIIVQTKKGIKKLIKSEIIFKLGENIFNGESLRGRPEELR